MRVLTGPSAASHDDVASGHHRAALTRRRALFAAVAAGSYSVGWRRGARADVSAEVVRGAMDQAVPASGVRLRFSFGDSIQKLVAAGAVDPAKYAALYRTTDGVPDWVQQLFAGPSSAPILFDSKAAPYLLNLLWPLGLASRLAINQHSPINTLRLPSFASTGGWTLGREQDGYVYFNRVESLRLTDRQEAQVQDVATTTFRPCCDNSTFFQDCNHGSALFGLLALAASQGATTDELYRLALAANGYWFPDRYVLAAIYFMRFRAQGWSELAPSMLLGAAFSSLSGWEQNVGRPLHAARITLPPDLARQLACGI